MSKGLNIKVLWRALLIALLASSVGLAVNSRLLWRVLSGRALIEAPATVSEPAGSPLPLPVDLDEVRELQGGSSLLIDARSREGFAEGHLPGARSLPRGEFERLLAGLRAEVPFSTPLIVYCSGYGCSDSFILAEQLIAAGYRQVRVYEGGFPEWRDAGLPVEAGQP